jgi:hypothetical protein
VKTATLLAVALGSLALSAACERPSTDAEPAVEILSPADGESPSLPVVVRLAARGVEVIPATGQAEPGKGHHHLIIDEEAPPDDAALPSPPGAIHLGNGASEYTIEGLTPGPHRIIAIFASGDHVPMRSVRRDTAFIVIR